MNKRQFIFLAILIILINYLTVYFCSGVEDWWGPVPKNPLNDVLAYSFLMTSITIDLIVVWYYGEKFYDWLGNNGRHN